jgi:hypothetical protein
LSKTYDNTVEYSPNDHDQLVEHINLRPSQKKPASVFFKDHKSPEKKFSLFLEDGFEGQRQYKSNLSRDLSHKVLLWNIGRIFNH